MSVVPAEQDSSVRNVHVGRQPIFDTASRAIGYELLFRPEATSATSGAESGIDPGDEATTTVILATFTSFGLRQLVGDGLAFVNLTRPFFVDRTIIPFGPENTVVEILETFPIDAQVVEGVRRLRAEGFAVALDDFLWDQTDRIPLLDDVTHVKVDISEVPPGGLGETAARLLEHDVTLVAERIETADELQECTDLGFQLFQGYHLLRPETLTTTELAPNALTCLDLVSRLSDPDLSLGDLESIVYRDAALTVRVLQAANAASSGSRHRFGSVREALVMLGTRRLTSWVMLLLAADAGSASTERLTRAVVRARTCETLAAGAGATPEVAFTAGLVSRLDLVLGTPPEAVIDRLALSGELRSAIVDHTGPVGRLLASVVAYEDGVRRTDCLTDAPCQRMADAHLEAMAWATRTVGGA